jgi:hypothetical protein
LSGGNGLPSTIILTEEQVQALEKVETHMRRRSVDQIMIQEPPDISNTNTLEETSKKKSPKQVKFDDKTIKKASKAVDPPIKRRSIDILIDEPIQDPSKKAPFTPSPSKAPRKLSPEEMATLYSDSPDQSHEQDPGVVENISQAQSELITNINVDWAKDWKISQTGENLDVRHTRIFPLKEPTSVARFESPKATSHLTCTDAWKGAWCYKIPQWLEEETDKKVKDQKGGMLD